MRRVNGHPVKSRIGPVQRQESSDRANGSEYPAGRQILPPKQRLSVDQFGGVYYNLVLKSQGGYFWVHPVADAQVERRVPATNGPRKLHQEWTRLKNIAQRGLDRERESERERERERESERE